MTRPLLLVVLLALLGPLAVSDSAAAESEPLPTVAMIGTGRVGSALGPRLAELGYPVVYGSRNP